eukprot:g5606.t1
MRFQRRRPSELALVACICQLLLFAAVSDNRCERQFTCGRCLQVPGCGWCDGFRYKLCHLENQRREFCNGGKDNWVGQEPPGQQCPSVIFEGASIGGKTSTEINPKTGKYSTEKMPDKAEPTVYRDLPWKVLSLTTSSSQAEIDRVCGRLVEFLQDGLEVDFKVSLAYDPALPTSNQEAKLYKKANSIANHVITVAMHGANGTTSDQQRHCLDHATCGKCAAVFHESSKLPYQDYKNDLMTGSTPLEGATYEDWQEGCERVSASSKKQLEWLNWLYKGAPFFVTGDANTFELNSRQK